MFRQTQSVWNLKCFTISVRNVQPHLMKCGHDTMQPQDMWSRTLDGSWTRPTIHWSSYPNVVVVQWHLCISRHRELFWSASNLINQSLENAGNARMQHIILLKENVLHLSYVSPSVQRRHIMVVCFVSILQKPWLSLYISQLYPPKKWKRGTAESRLVCTFFWQHIPALVNLLLLSCYPDLKEELWRVGWFAHSFDDTSLLLLSLSNAPVILVIPGWLWPSRHLRQQASSLPSPGDMLRCFVLHPSFSSHSSSYHWTNT